MFGVFNVNYCQPQTFTDADQRVLEALARRAAIAVQNAELYERAQVGAVLEERQRLARELHDAVTQTLFSASLIGEVLPMLVEHRPAEAARRADELRRLTRGALAEMRTLLVELRPGALSDMPLGRPAPPARRGGMVTVQVEALDRARLLSDITKTLADLKVNILSANLSMSKDGMAISRFSFEMADPTHLGHLVHAVRNVDGVYDVTG